MKKLFIICGLLFIFGCQTPTKRPINYYKISIIRPNGEVQKEINISSYEELYTNISEDGHMFVEINQLGIYIGKKVVKNTIVPKDWFINCELTGVVVEQE